MTSSESDTENDYDYSKNHITREEIETFTGFRPLNINHYCQAFVHKSIQKFTKNNSTVMSYTKQSYERYEYLGDSVLSLIIASYLFKKYPEQNEGFLTRIRTKLVNGKMLAFLSKKLDLGKFILMSSNVEKINGRENDRILEDVFEALICAIYLDLGFEKTSRFVINVIEKYIDFESLEIDDNYKDILLRFCQSKVNTTPTYETIEVSGLPHLREFKVACFIQGIKYKCGSGKCKKAAEQLAAKETLIHFGQLN
jgi:ribonuclease-3